jgi:hypothetical protein
MTDIKSLAATPAYLLFLYTILLGSIFSGCIEPNVDDLWSVSVETVIETDGFSRDVFITGNTAFIAAGQAGVYVWDLATNAIIRTHNTYGNADLEDVSRVYYDSLNSFLFIRDQTNLFFFEYDSASLDAPNFVGDSHIEDFAIFPDTANQFFIYYTDKDVGDGFIWGQYKPLGWFWYLTGGGVIKPDAPMRGISVSESYVAIAMDQLGVELYSIDSIGADPTLIGRVDTEGNAEQVTLDQMGVFAACDDAGAYFITTGKFSGTGSSTRFAEDLTVDHIAVNNGIAVLSLGSKGIALYDVTDPSSPIEKGIFPVGYVYKSEFWGEKLLVCSREGLQILSIEQ